MMLDRISLEWLNRNGGLATWLALIVAIVTVVIQNRGKKFHEIDWSRLLLYLAFLVGLGVAFTPQVDPEAQRWARGLVYALLGFLIVDRMPHRERN